MSTSQFGKARPLGSIGSASPVARHFTRNNFHRSGTLQEKEVRNEQTFPPENSYFREYLMKNAKPNPELFVQVFPKMGAEDNFVRPSLLKRKTATDPLAVRAHQRDLEKGQTVGLVSRKSSKAFNKMQNSDNKRNTMVFDEEFDFDSDEHEAAPKRGRPKAVPPKAKEAAPAKRGRPAKASAKVEAPKRGRPPKAAVVNEAPKRGRPKAAAANEAPKRGRPAKAAANVEAPKRGRPPKAKVEAAPAKRGRPAKAAANVEAPKRGRPPKANTTNDTPKRGRPPKAAANAAPAKRGRPPKVVEKATSGRKNTSARGR